MVKKPIRHNNHIQEGVSRHFFEGTLPIGWTAYKPENDYGVDLIVDIFEGNMATGLNLFVQLKSSGIATVGVNEKIRLKTTTYNLLDDMLEIVLLVKYVVEENQAYWILLTEVPTPNQEQESFTIHIPKTNIFSAESWTLIKNHIQAVTDIKLAAGRARKQQIRRQNI